MLIGTHSGELAYLRHIVLGLIQVLITKGKVSNELDVVVMGDPPLSIIPDSISDCDAQVLNASQQVRISNHVSPHCAAVGHLYSSRQMVEENRISSVVPVQDGIDVLLILRHPLSAKSRFL